MFIGHSAAQSNIHHFHEMMFIHKYWPTPSDRGGQRQVTALKRSRRILSDRKTVGIPFIMQHVRLFHREYQHRYSR